MRYSSHGARFESHSLILIQPAIGLGVPISDAITSQRRPFQPQPSQGERQDRTIIATPKPTAERHQQRSKADNSQSRPCYVTRAGYNSCE